MSLIEAAELVTRRPGRARQRPKIQARLTAKARLSCSRATLYIHCTYVHTYICASFLGPGVPAASRTNSPSSAFPAISISVSIWTNSTAIGCRTSQGPAVAWPPLHNLNPGPRPNSSWRLGKLTSVWPTGSKVGSYLSAQPSFFRVWCLDAGSQPSSRQEDISQLHDTLSVWACAHLHLHLHLHLHICTRAHCVWPETGKRLGLHLALFSLSPSLSFSRCLVSPGAKSQVVVLLASATWFDTPPLPALSPVNPRTRALECYLELTRACHLGTLGHPAPQEEPVRHIIITKLWPRSPNPSHLPRLPVAAAHVAGDLAAMPSPGSPSPGHQQGTKRQRQSSYDAASDRNSQTSPSEQLAGDASQSAAGPANAANAGPAKGGQSSNFRNVSACNRCRLRKNRCDQKLPSCASCAKAGVACVGYDPITKKEIPRRYVCEFPDIWRYAQVTRCPGIWVAWVNDA